MRRSETKISNRPSRPRFSDLAFFIFVLTISLCRADEISEIHIATSLTRLDPLNNLKFLSSEKNRYQITVTDGHGYAEHLVIGYFESPQGLAPEPVAFFQSWEYDPGSKKTSAIRKVVTPNMPWRDIFERFAISSIERMFQKANKEIEIRGGGEVYFGIARESASQTECRLRFGEFRHENGIEGWLKEFESIFSFSWRVRPTPLSPPVLIE